MELIDLWSWIDFTRGILYTHFRSSDKAIFYYIMVNWLLSNLYTLIEQGGYLFTFITHSREKPKHIIWYSSTNLKRPQSITYYRYIHRIVHLCIEGTSVLKSVSDIWHQHTIHYIFSCYSSTVCTSVPPYTKKVNNVVVGICGN